MTLKKNTTPVIPASDPAITTNTLQSPFNSVGNGLRSAQTGNTPPIRCALVNTNNALYTDCGTVYQTCINRSTTNQFVQCSISTLNVGLTDSSNIYCNVLPGIERLAFDTDSGFDVTDIGNATAKIGMNSTFKCWNVNGSPGLIACGLDTVNFIAGSGINITSDNALIPKTFTISSTGGGGGGTPGGCNTQVQFNNSGTFSGDTGLTYNCVTKTVGMCCIQAPMDTNLNLKVSASESTWYAEYGDSPTHAREDYSSSAVYDSQGNLIFVGADANNGVPYVVKYDSNGILLWQKQFDSSDYKSGDIVVVDSLDNVYCALYSNGTPQVYILVKLDSSGNLVWQNAFDGSTALSVYDMTVDGSNNIILSVSGDSRAAILKISSTGSIVWQKYYQDSVSVSHDSRGIITDSANNIYVSADLEDTLGLLILKLDSDGTVIWGKRFATNTTQYHSGFMAIDSLNNIYTAGTQFSFSGGNTFLAKFDSDGNFLWQRNIENNPRTYGIATDNSDNVYISMSDDGGTPTTNYGFITVKFDSSGNTVWQRVFDGVDGEYQWYYNSFDQINTHGDYYAINGYTYTTDPDNSYSEAIVAQFKQDGTGTGTYDNFTYAEITLTINSTVFSTTTATINTGTLPHVVAPGTLTISNATNSSSTITMTGGILNYNFGIDGFGIGNYIIPKTSGSEGQALVSTNTCYTTWCTIKPTLTSDNNFIVRQTALSSCGDIGSNNIAIGQSSMFNSCGYENIAIGTFTLPNNLSIYNIGIGGCSLVCNTNGSNNTGIGYLSLYSNTTGSRNVAIGQCAMYCNVDGLCNVAVGFESLKNLISGEKNIAIGARAMCSNICGSHNIALGQLAGGGGLYNISIGDSAGQGACQNSTGNISIGLGAGSYLLNTSSVENVYIGTNSGGNSSNNSNGGCFNVGIGYSALNFGNFNKINNHNIGIGYFASSLCNNCYTTYIGSNVGEFYCNTNGNTHIGMGKCIPVLSCVGGTNQSYTVHLTSGIPTDCQSRLLINNMGAFINTATDCNNSNTICSGGIWTAGLNDGSVGGSSTNVDWNLNKETIRYFNNVSNQLNNDFSITIRGDFFWPYLGLGAPENMIELRLVLTQSATPIKPGSVYIQTKSMGLNGPFIQTLKWLNNSIPTPNANRIDVFIITLYNYGDNFVAIEMKSY